MKPDKFISVVKSVFPDAKLLNDHGMIYSKFCMKGLEKIVTTIILNAENENILKMVGDINDPKDLEFSDLLVDEVCIGDMVAELKFMKSHEWKPI